MTRSMRRPPSSAWAGILWDVVPFDWINDADTAATRYMSMTQIRPGSVVLFHDTYSSTVDLVYQFLPVLKANGYHLVTVSELLGRARTGKRVRRTRERSAGQRAARHSDGGYPGAAGHTFAAADAEFPDHRYRRRDSGEPNNGA